MREITIDGRTISDSSPCWVIAEVGGNHGGSVETALKMIRVASGCNADAVKFQLRDNKNLYAPSLLNQPYENEHSYGKTYGEHRDALELSQPDFARCMVEAQASKITCFATAFDEVSADRILALGMPAIKIASGGLTDHALLAHVARARVPIVLSTGGGTFREVDEAVNTITRYHEQLALLQCVASYPVRDFAELNLKVIQTMRERYPYVIGWSGHDSGIAMAVLAYAFGARIIEKHFCLNRADKGGDQSFSLEPSGMSKMVRDLKRAHAAVGDGIKRYLPSEVAPIAKMRRRETPDGLKITGAKDDITAA